MTTTEMVLETVVYSLFKPHDAAGSVTDFYFSLA